MMIKPKALKKGDEVAIIAPASPTTEEKVKKALEALRKWGLIPIAYPSCYASHGHLSGTDDMRAKDVNDAFRDKKIRGIINLKGGYGAPRILKLIDYDLIRTNPKIFLGYSDISGLLIAINKNVWMVTYHGPMAAAGLSMDLDDYTKKYVDMCLFGNESLGILENPQGEKLISLVKGLAEGELIGGNLSLMVSTLGSDFEIDVKNKILFIEEIGEKNYKIDRMLTSLSLAGKFRDCIGIIIGPFSNCEAEIKTDKYTDLSLNQIFNEIILPYNKPTIMNFRAGHIYPQATIPFGVKVEINANKPSIKFLESGNECDE